MSDNKNPQTPPRPPPPPPRRRREGNPEESGTPPRGAFAAWLVVLAGFVLMLYMMKGDMPLSAVTLKPDEFYEGVQQGTIRGDTCEIVQRDMAGHTTIRGTRKKDGKDQHFRIELIMPEQKLTQFSNENKFNPVFSPPNPIWAVLLDILPVLLFLGLLYFLFMRQVKSSGMGAMNFGRSRAKMLNQDKQKITFANVAGIKEAKEEVEEIIDFLKSPQKFQKLGGRIPKGVLLMGPPGTGKTLLAKAIAGEAGVPFFSISGSDFVEMFVGVGASRVRDMFEQGKKSAPCLIFIDEIDAVGRSRFTGIGGGHDEREQTLNALLVEMDGFDTQEGVIIIAATNRPDVLDSALLRPGRFDRQIVIDLPSLSGREEILRLHAKKLTLGTSADLRRIARGTPGFSGADLANLLNEAALLAARQDKPAIEMCDLEEARDKELWGRERRSRGMDEKERLITAWHESGHALVQAVMEHTEPLHKVTIIPRGMALGATMSLPEKDVLNKNLSQLTDELTVMMGGRIAEKIHTGDISTGAYADIRMASSMARRMVCEYGMSEAIGSQSLGSGNQELMFLGREVSRTQQYSEATAQRIDAEVSRLLHEAYVRAEKVITEHRVLLDKIVERLLEIETMDGREVDELVEYGRFLTEEERAAKEKEREAAEAAQEAAKEAAKNAKDAAAKLAAAPKSTEYVPPPSPLIPPPAPPGSGEASKTNQD